ncbi:MAG: polysaccharide deacetylase family protein [Ignavibacteriaceae bacterium]
MKTPLKYEYTPPGLIKGLFSSFQWESNTNKILLTFDDGPIPGNTELILKKLNELNLKAIFFCVGENVQKYPELAKLILDEGHVIGNHTFNHRRVTKTLKEETILQIQLFNIILKEKFNYTVKYFRPPCGRFKLSTNGILKREKLQNVMWTLLSYDYKSDFNIVKFGVDKYLKNNSIVVLHDSLKSKDIIIDSIRYIYDVSESRGFRIGEPAECLK